MARVAQGVRNVRLEGRPNTVCNTAQVLAGALSISLYVTFVTERISLSLYRSTTLDEGGERKKLIHIEREGCHNLTPNISNRMRFKSLYRKELGHCYSSRGANRCA